MLAFTSVSRVFPGGAGVSKLSFSVEPGEIVALIGLNGACRSAPGRGKAWLLRCNTIPDWRRMRSGPCRDRTDDIHGVNVALYQLS